jgi:hypothetical protein
MPVDISSRYRPLPVADAPDRTGITHPTIGLRLADPQTPADVVHRLKPLETLEYLAWRQYSNSRYWWRIADANPRVFPLDWTTGDAVRVPGVTQAPLVQRGRSF